MEERLSDGRAGTGQSDDRRLKIKVCGMKNPENIASLAGLAPDYMGLIRFAGSPRYAGDRLDAFFTDGWGTNFTAGIHLTGVYVDAPIKDVVRESESIGFGAVQLHGSESPAYCRELKERLRRRDGAAGGGVAEDGIAGGRRGLTLIKAFGISPGFDWKQLEAYLSLVDLFLFDTKSPSHGGTGKKFDWGLLAGYTLDVPYFLSGGIGPEDINDILEIQDARLYGADLNSRYETSPGMKNIDLLQETFIKLRNEQVPG